MTFKEKFDQYVKDYANTAGYSSVLLALALFCELYNIEYNGLSLLSTFHSFYFLTTFLLYMYYVR